MEKATAAHRPLEMETASCMQSATGCGVRAWERGDFRRGHSLHIDKVRRAPRWTGQIQAGRGGRLMGLGVHAGEWSALPPRGTGPAPCKGNNTFFL
jgi:hypothetical protein